jgi:ATP-binding cassette subfamily B protein
VTELRIQKALAILLKNRTSLVVAHRLSTIRHADLVLVMNDGKLIEQGSHSRLLRKRGHYASLYRQFIS